jgi:Ca2+/H+ antiporter
MYFNLSLIVLYVLEAFVITLAIYIISQKTKLNIKELFVIFSVMLLGIYVVNQFTIMNKFEHFTDSALNPMPQATFDTLLPPSVDMSSHVVPLNNNNEHFTDNLNAVDNMDKYASVNA